MIEDISLAACIDMSSMDVEDAMERLRLLCEGSEAMRVIDSMSEMSILDSDHKNDEGESSPASMQGVEHTRSTAFQYATAAASAAAAMAGTKISPVCISTTSTH